MDGGVEGVGWFQDKPIFQNRRSLQQVHSPGIFLVLIYYMSVYFFKLYLRKSLLLN
ncbi:hypothetical protein Mapa_000450 [Marchantia paleacea]|nr:hypothetical protein Mapa_000450 [Marchantia paleacea]